MPGIKHIEFWVTDLRASLKFYDQLFSILEWKKIDENAFSDGVTKIYFIEQPVSAQRNVGPRHICFLAKSKPVVDSVGAFVRASKRTLIRGPIEATYLNRSSYTVDFKDPNGYILEVATKSVAL
jgi:catechol 2,3-dioxygenase-like lactoylglutathione lyase family enzyme